MTNIVETKRELYYGFDADGPSYQLSHGGSYNRTFKVDPAPCYTHDEALVRSEFERLQEIAPLPMPLAVFILSHEKVGRTNGEYCDDHAYGGVVTSVDYVARDGRQSSRYPPVGYIVLSGKRIPPHPAMTRYLVAHEYGHAVQYHLDRLRDVKDGKPEVLTDYAAVRPTATRAYGCGKWHQALGELFANDFRILVANCELEFWPHAGFENPLTSPVVCKWWALACEELGWALPPMLTGKAFSAWQSVTPEHVESV